MSALDFHTLAQLVAEQLLNTFVAGVILAGLVSSMLRLIRGQNAGIRFAILSLALLGIAALPVISAFTLHRSGVSNIWPVGAHGGIILPASWACLLFAAWAIGAVLLLLRLALGVWRVAAVRRNSIEVDLAKLDPAVAQSLRMFGTHRPVSLCTSDELSVPAALGLCKPAVVFPAGLLPRLSADEIEMIVQHELAHLCRWDDWTNLVQKIVKALLFFHPAVWWIDNRLSLEREMACDDFVLALARPPRAYAACLVSVAEKLESLRRLAFAQALLSRMHQLSLRVARILDRKRPTRLGIWKPVMGLSAGLLAFVFCAASYMPQLVAFQAQPSETNARAQDTNVAVNHPLNHATVVHAVAGTAATKQPARPATTAIPAAFHPYAAVAKRQFRVNPPHAPHVMRAVARQSQPSIQRTVFILRAPGYSVYRPPAPVWTLCIWTIGADDSANQTLQSAIVVSWI